MDHEAFLTAVWGELPFEDERSPVNPWQVQMATDLQQVLRLEDGSTITAAAEGDFLSLLADDSQKDDFIRLDVTRLRSEFWEHGPWLDAPARHQASEEYPFECKI